VSKSVSAAVGSVSKSLDISKSLPSVSVSKSVEVGLCSVRCLEVFWKYLYACTKVAVVYAD
jgi:hypothetical protein